MKAAVLNADGEKNHILVQDEPMPEPKNDELLIRVKACSLSHMDKAMMIGDADKTIKKLQKRSNVVTGVGVSGIVVSDGKRFKKGDAIIAAIDYSSGVRAHAEYTVIPERFLGEKPGHWSYEEAAAVPTGLVLAIEALEKQARIEAGQSVLIHGASGGVGAYAVQLANHHGCKVYATANEANTSFVETLGAHYVQDYSKGLPTNVPFNIVFDVPGVLTFSNTVKHMDPKGVFITTQPLKDLGGGLRAVFSGKKWTFVYASHSGKNRMARLLQLAQHRIVKPIVDSIYQLDEIQDAFDRYLNSSIRGRIVIRID